MIEMYEEQIDTYEIGYSKFDEIAVCGTRTWKYAKPPREEKRVQFDGIGLSKSLEHYISQSDPEYNDMIELRGRYEWVKVPYPIYKHMLQYIREHSPF